MASYPSSIVSLATHNDGDTIFAADVNNPNAEIVAVETGLINGIAHNLKALSDNTYTIGNSTNRFATGYFAGLVLGPANASALQWPNLMCQGRLTLTTVTPVTNSDVLAATTLYFSPYSGNSIALYDGSAYWVRVDFSEINIAVPATTNQMYDVFVFNSSGTAALELTAWTNDTTRATALVLQNGVLVRSGATTRRYVGSFRTTGVSGQTEDSAKKRYVWNYYNRVLRTLYVTDATASWTYTTATWRQANGNAANQLDIVVGYSEDQLYVQVTQATFNASSVWVNLGIGEDSATTPVSGATSSVLVPASNTQSSAMPPAMLTKVPAVGRHFYAWLEASQAAGSTQLYGTGAGGVGGNLQTSAISGVWRA